MEVEEAILLYSLIKKKKTVKRAKIINWVQPIIQFRDAKGHFRSLFHQILHEIFDIFQTMNFVLLFHWHYSV